MAKPIRQLSNVNITIQKGLAAASEIFEQLDHDNENDEGISNIIYFRKYRI